MEHTIPRSRLLPFDLVFNFRDLGGYEAADGRTVRWGTLFRADSLHRLTGAELDRFHALGIRTVIDLRTDGERTQWGVVAPGEDPLTVHHLPLLQATWEEVRAEWAQPTADAPAVFLAGRYLAMLDEGSGSIATVLRLVAGGDGDPVVFHCTAGKDRTGVLSAVVLSLLGVGDDDIVEDYALSAAAMAQLDEWFRANAPAGVDLRAPRPEALLAAPPEAMRLLLEDVRARFGSMEGYAESIGVRAGVVDALRRLLLDG